MLEDEVQERIPQSSLGLFLQHGFERTPIEGIVKQAHISKSNLCNYFRPKDETFKKLTSSTVNKFVKIVDQLSTSQSILESCEVGFEDMIVTRIFDLISDNRNELLLLMLYLEDTKYEKLKEQLIGQVALEFMQGYRDYFSDSDPVVTIITRNLFDGIIDVTIYSQSPKELHLNLHKFIRYHIEGFSALISD